MDEPSQLAHVMLFLVLLFNSFHRIIPAALLMCVLGAFSAYSFYMIPRLTRLDESNDHKRTMSISQAWEKEVGKDSAWIVSLIPLLLPHSPWYSTHIFHRSGRYALHARTISWVIRHAHVPSISIDGSHIGNPLPTL